MLSRLVMAKPVVINNSLAATAFQGSRQFHSSWFKGLFGGQKEEAQVSADQPKKKVPIKLRKSPEAIQAKKSKSPVNRKIKLELETDNTALLELAKKKNIRLAAAKSKQVPSQELRQELESLDRSSRSNMYQRVQRRRPTKKELNSHDRLATFLHPALLANERVTIQKFSAREFKRGLAEDEEPFPISPTVGPMVVDKPVLGKNYFWCSCGMSKKQPFCDSSHKGTSFGPLKFALDEKVKEMHLCGCKLTK